MNDLTHLFYPITIKNMALSNRCVMPPMGTGLKNNDQTVSETGLAYMKRRAQSSLGYLGGKNARRNRTI